MSFYHFVRNHVLPLFGEKKHILFKYIFNYSPMYSRTTAKIQELSKDLKYIQIKLPISYKNRNFARTIFGGSMYAAVDPIAVSQFVHLLGKDYVVWDKSAQIAYKKPARVDLYADFNVTDDEIKNIKEILKTRNHTEIEKTVQLTNKDKSKVFCEVKRVVYIANKRYYKQKMVKIKAQSS